MGKSGVALTICDRNIITGVTSVDSIVKQWLHSRGQGMSVSLCVTADVYIPFVRCYKEVEYEHALWDLI